MSLSNFKANHFLVKHTTLEWNGNGDNKVGSKEKKPSLMKKLFLLAALGVVAPNENSTGSTDASTSTKCGLPDEFSTLPDYAQKELEAIWSFYTEGTDCEAEKQKTKDILEIVKQFGEEFGPEKDTKDKKKEEKIAEIKKDKDAEITKSSSSPIERDDPEAFTTTVESKETTEATEATGTTEATEATEAITEGSDLDLTSVLSTESSTEGSTEAKPEASTTGLETATEEEIEDTTTVPTIQQKPPNPKKKLRTQSQKKRRLPQRRIASNQDVDYDAEDFQGNTPQPTQGKIPKAPNEYDYLDPHQKAEFKRYEHWKKQQQGHLERDDDYDQRKPRKKTPIGSRIIHAHPTKFIDDYHDDEHEEHHSEGSNSADPLAAKFDTPEAPFLRDAAPSVRREFVETWNDQDIPSEPLRAQKIQLLAVSLLNGKQLGRYNAWATNRRRVLKAREQELSELSPAARRMLRRLSNTSNTKNLSIHPRIKQELRDFIERHRRRVAARVSKAVA